jgi:hypothetical protein
LGYLLPVNLDPASMAPAGPVGAFRLADDCAHRVEAECHFLGDLTQAV